jgi:hypothetical protein
VLFNLARPPGDSRNAAAALAVGAFGAAEWRIAGIRDPDYVGKSMSKSKYADSMVEMDARVGHIMDKLRELGIDKNTLVAGMFGWWFFIKLMLMKNGSEDFAFASR